MNMNALNMKEEDLMISLEQLQKIQDYMKEQKLTHVKLNFLILHHKDTRFLVDQNFLKKQEERENNSLYKSVLKTLSISFRFSGWSYSHFNVYKDNPSFSYTMIQRSVNEQVLNNKKMKMHTLFIVDEPNLFNFIVMDNVNYILI